MRRTSFFALPVVVLMACTNQPVHQAAWTLREGPWHIELDLRTDTDDQAVRLPFVFDLHSDSGAWSMVIHNGAEAIQVDDVTASPDSFYARPPLFDPYLAGRPLSDSVITGYWYNPLRGPEYRVPFIARAGVSPRFSGSAVPGPDPSGDWACRFMPGSPDEYAALGIFERKDGIVTGTFATETGDYRFLEGVSTGDSLFLSAFDGSHAYLFAASYHGDSLVGQFRSGTHSNERWVASRHAGFQLRNPDSLTFLKPGHSVLDLLLPDLDGHPVSPGHERFFGHVRIVQLMGSWCANCMDETALLNDLYGRYHPKGLDVIAVGFEKHPDPTKAREALQRYKERLGLRYDVLYGGQAGQQTTAAQLPFLERLVSYPTLIIIDRAGNVRRINTGFYGPGTGKHHALFKRELTAFLEGLLAESGPTTVATR